MSCQGVEIWLPTTVLGAWGACVAWGGGGGELLGLWVACFLFPLIHSFGKAVVQFFLFPYQIPGPSFY